MARYKHYDYNQTKMILLRFADQIQPGPFEYTLNHVVDNDLDLSVFDSCYRNDYNRAPAYDPAILLKIVLFAYSRGITSSRRIAQACPLKNQCLRKRSQSFARQVQFNLTEKPPERSYTDRMKDKIDSPMGRHIYSQRLGAVEPVLGNIETNKALNRFTLRGQQKVNAQWLMYCMVHNIEKIATQGQYHY